jgi:hypothetical protein
MRHPTVSKPLFNRLFRVENSARARHARRAAALRSRPCLDVLEGRQLLSTTLQVNNSADSGANTLRQAILGSNATPATPSSPNVIQLNFATPTQIVLYSQLPTISQPTVIDASNISTRGVGLQLIGNYAGPSAIGLVIQGSAASGTVIRNIDISGFNAGGLLINGASGVTIDKDDFGTSLGMNDVGVDPTNPNNNLNFGNGVYGVTIEGGAQHDIISNSFIDNTQYNGLIINGTNTDYNQVIGTAIGTDNTFGAATDDNGGLLGNGLRGGGGSGVVINQGASYNTIGGTTAAARDVIVSNKSYGVYITDGNTVGNVVAGDSIGVNQAGTADNDGNGHAIGNQLDGVAIVNGANNNTISGTYGAAEIISGNGGNGVQINDGFFNKVTGVKIGTDVNGNYALANAGDGVLITAGSQQNTIGGTTFIQNVISGNTGNGVEIAGSSLSNTVSANLIGTSGSGTGTVPNRNDGVLIDGASQSNTIGGSSLTLANTISGNANHGVEIIGQNTASNTVQYNFIGTDVSGEKALGNVGSGVVVHGAASGNTIGPGNVISANHAWGVFISDSGTNSNVVDGNIIGLDAAGVKSIDSVGNALGNAFNGLDVYNGAGYNTIGGTTASTRNIISGNLNEGILIGTPSGGPISWNNVVEGNYIGTDKSGTLPRGNGRDGVYVGLGSGGTVIGGATAAARNIISGNITDGIVIYNGGTTVQNDFIGTDSTGTVKLGNEGNGIELFTATADTITGDVISGNFGSGVVFNSGANNNQVVNSMIGTDPSATKNLANNGNGVLSLGGVNNNVLSDTIAFNGDWGVLTSGGSQTLVAYDSIFANVLGGIDVFNAPVTEPAPLITQATLAPGQISIFGLTSAPTPVRNGTVTFQFFSSPQGTGNQGKTLIGQVSAQTDAMGNATFAATFKTVVAPGSVITATLTDINSNTSAFSNAVTLPPEKAPVINAVSPQTVSSGSSLHVNLSGTLYNGAPTYSATAETQLYYLKSTLGLYEDAGGFATNYRGQGEKYLRGKVSFDNYPSQGTDYWYYITPNGNLYEFTPSYSNPKLVGALVAQLGTAVYSNPTLLIGATNTAVPVSLSVSGSRLTITPNSGFTGTFVTIATLSDGFASSSTAFNVSVVIATPVLTPISSLTMPAGGTDTVTISATDASNVPLTYSATAQPQTSNLKLNLSVSGNQLTISSPAGVSGSAVVTVTATAGTQNASETFVVTVHAGDKAPVIAPIANQSIPTAAAEQLPIQVSDADHDTLTVTATAETQLYYLKSTLGLYEDAGGFYTNSRGQQEKYLRGKVSFDHYANQGTDYWYYLLPNGNLYEFTPSYTNPKLVGALVAQLGTAVYNNPTLLTSATNTAVPLSVYPSLTTIGIAPTGQTAGTFVVIVTVSDGLDSTSDAFQVTVTPLV